MFMFWNFSNLAYTHLFISSMSIEDKQLLGNCGNCARYLPDTCAKMSTFINCSANLFTLLTQSTGV